MNAIYDELVKLKKMEKELESMYQEQNSPNWSNQKQLILQQLEDDVEELKEEIYGF